MKRIGELGTTLAVFTAMTMKNDTFCDSRRVALVKTDVSEERISPSSG
jgi:hypothetical protein